MTDRKLIFLDIDGVLNSVGSAIAFHDHHLKWVNQNHQKNLEGRELSLQIAADTATTVDPTAVGLINELIRRTGAQVVLSSTHRVWCMHKVPNIYGYDYFPDDALAGDYLRVLGLECEVAGMTPRTNRGYRGEEILQWLDKHPCSTYVIIDDDSDMLPAQKDGHFVHTDGHSGFGYHDFKLALAILGDASRDDISMSRFGSADPEISKLKINQLTAYTAGELRGVGRVVGISGDVATVCDMSGNFHDYDDSGEPSVGRYFLANLTNLEVFNTTS